MKGSKGEAFDPISVQLLGYPSIKVGTEVHLKFRSNRILALLGFLSIHPGHISRDEIARSLWPDAMDEVARHNLRQTILYTRQLIGPSGISSEGSFVALNPEIQVDVRTVFDALDLEADSRCLQIAEDAVAAYGGVFLPGFADEWLLQPRAQLESAYVRALLVLADHVAALQPKEALKKLDLALQVDPLSEEVRARRICLMRSMGLHVAARQEYEGYKQLLFRELTIAPSPLVENALRTDQEVKAPSPVTEMPDEWRRIEALLQGTRPHQGVELAIALTPVWSEEGAADKGSQVLERILTDFGTRISPKNQSGLLFAKAQLRLALGDLKEARSEFTVLADREDSPAIQARSNLALVRLEMTSFRAPQALRRFHIAQEVIELNGLVDESWELKRLAAGVALFQNDLELAERAAKSALVLAGELNDPLAQGRALLDLAEVNLSLGKTSDAGQTARSAMTVLKNIATADASAIRTAVVRFEEGLGVVEGIEEGYRRGATESATYGTPFTTAVCLTYLGDFLSSQLRYAEALDVHKEALEIRRALDEQLGMATSYRGLGIAYIGLGRDEEAREALSESARMFLGVGALPGHASALLSLAKVDLRAGHPDVALRFASRALQLLRGMSPNELRAIGPQGTQYLSDAETLVLAIQEDL